MGESAITPPRDDPANAGAVTRPALPVTVLLDPGRAVTVSVATAADTRAAERPVAPGPAGLRGDGRLAEILAGFAPGEGGGSDAAVLLARDRGDHVVAVAAYGVTQPGGATVVGRVDRRYRNLGLGTFLLRRLAEIALDHGVERFRLRVEPGDDDTELAALLRDCGLRSRWHLGTITLVDLDLRARRPGWATPECATEPYSPPVTSPRASA